MAFVLDSDPIQEEENLTAYVQTYNTEDELTNATNFCPLCEVPESFTTPSGNKPIAQLHKVIGDLQIENKLSPSAFIKFISKYYNDRVKSQLVNVLHWLEDSHQTISTPEWPVHAIYTHFSQHVADPWLGRQEALRQTNVMLKATGNRCLTNDGPPNQNTVKMFVELSKLRESLFTNIAPPPFQKDHK